jgi:hypothetical protein
MIYKDIYQASFIPSAGWKPGDTGPGRLPEWQVPACELKLNYNTRHAQISHPLCLPAVRPHQRP